MDEPHHVQAAAVIFTDELIRITLTDGRVFDLLVTDFKWLQAATSEQRANYEVTPIDIFWPDLDDGIDMEALLHNTWIHPLSSGV